MSGNGNGGSILEKVLEKAPKMTGNIYVEITAHFEGPWFYVAKEAVEMLGKPYEIRSFMEQFIGYIQQEYSVPHLDEARTYAENAIGYCTGYVSDERANTWFDTLPNIKHPTMGRKRPFIKEADGGYLVTCKAEDRNIKLYLETVIKQQLEHTDFGPSFEVKPFEADNEFLIALQLTLKDKGICSMDSDVYIFLQGYLNTLELQINRVTENSYRFDIQAVPESLK